jgi:ElaB/YqjD/DUF883 family membrane-anchored ribosome-binding protein
MEKVDELKGKLPGGDGEGGIGETIKTKLPSGEDVSDKVDALKSKMPDGVGEAASRVGDKAPSRDDVKAKAQEAAATAGEHPIAVAAGAAVAGLAAGLALPETDLERQSWRRPLKPRARRRRPLPKTPCNRQEPSRRTSRAAPPKPSSRPDSTKAASSAKPPKRPLTKPKTRSTSQADRHMAQRWRALPHERRRREISVQGGC